MQEGASYSGRLLLRDAVQRAKAPNEFVTVDRNDFAAREARGDDRVGLGVAFFLAEIRHEHRAVDDEKIRVAGRHRLAVKGERLGHGQLNDVELLAFRSPEHLQTLQVFREDFVVRVALVGLDHGDETVGFVETRDVVDMAIGVVTDDAIAHPQHLRNAEVVLEVLLDLLARKVRVAVFIEQALLAGEEQALAIHLDGATFEDHVVFETAQLELLCDERRDGVVEIVGRVFAAPSGVHPIGDGELTGLGILDEDRTVIAAPRVIRRVIVEGNLGQIGARFGDERPSAFLKRLGDVDAHLFEAADLRNNASEHIRNRAELPRPRGAFMRPREPDGGLRSPLGGHAKAE